MFYGAGEELVILYIACVMFEIDGEGSDSARMGEKAWSILLLEPTNIE